MKILSLLCLVLLTSNCAVNLKDIRHGSPNFTLSSELSAKTLANRIVYESTQETINNKIFRDWDPAKLVETEDGSQKLLITFTGVHPLFMISYPPIAVAEIKITPKTSGGSMLEYWGIDWSKKDKFIDLIQKCASSQNAPGK
jgi:hypothetical protein